jgi:hypothetical protein
MSPLRILGAIVPLAVVATPPSQVVDSDSHELA